MRRLKFRDSADEAIEASLGRLDVVMSISTICERQPLTLLTARSAV